MLFRSQLARAERAAAQTQGNPLVLVAGGILALGLVAVLGYLAYTMFGKQETGGPTTYNIEVEARIDFPTDTSLGEVFTRPFSSSDEAAWQSFAEAKGLVKLPGDTAVRLVISEGGMANLAAIEGVNPDALYSLVLPSVAVTPTLLAPVKKLTGLRELVAKGIPADDSLADELRAALPNCAVNLGAPRALAQISDSPPPARTLRFPAAASLGKVYTRAWKSEGEWNQLGPAQGDVAIPSGSEAKLEVAYEAAGDLSPLAKLGAASLQELGLTGEHLTDAQLVHISNLTGLKKLRLILADKVTDAGIEALRNLLLLEDLTLQGVALSDEGLPIIGRMQNLRRFAIIDGAISNRGLRIFKQLPNLKQLHIQDTRATSEGIEMLRFDLPNVTIEN